MIVKQDILTQISVGNSVDPVTKTNWETVGVKPDAETSADDALRAAHLLALRALVEKTSSDDARRAITNLLEEQQ